MPLLSVPAEKALILGISRIKRVWILSSSCILRYLSISMYLLDTCGDYLLAGKIYTYIINWFISIISLIAKGKQRPWCEAIESTRCAKVNYLPILLIFWFNELYGRLHKRHERLIWKMKPKNLCIGWFERNQGIRRLVAGFVLSEGSNSGPSFPIPTFSPITPPILFAPLKQLTVLGSVLLGERFKAPPAGSGAEPQPQTILMHFRQKGMPPV